MKAFMDIPQFVKLYVQVNPILSISEIAEKLGVASKSPYRWLKKEKVVSILQAVKSELFRKKLYEEAMKGNTQDRRLYAEHEEAWSSVQKIEQSVKVKGELSIDDIIDAESKREQNRKV